MKFNTSHLIMATIALLVVLFDSADAQLPYRSVPESQPKKWEYKILHVERPDLFEYMQKINSYGQEGWELFDVEVIGIDKKEEPTYICWYKRPHMASNPGKLPDPKGEWNKLLIE